jgi:type VI secretion system secreted protein Hcp
MAIYMKYGSIKGAVTTQGFAGWMELDTFQWGAARLIGSAQGSQANRESSTPTISEVTVTKVGDIATPNLFLEAVASQMNNEVTIKFTTTTKGTIETFLTFVFENTGLSHYSISSQGEMPMESLTLNFTKISETFIGMDPAVSGSPQTVGFDLALLHTT